MGSQMRLMAHDAANGIPASLLAMLASAVSQVGLSECKQSNLWPKPPQQGPIHLIAYPGESTEKLLGAAKSTPAGIRSVVASEVM